MKLLVDSGSTKADWIAIDNQGKIIFTTRTLGLNPEILSEEEIISRLNGNYPAHKNGNDSDESKRTCTKAIYLINDLSEVDGEFFRLAENSY